MGKGRPRLAQGDWRRDLEQRTDLRNYTKKQAEASI